MGKLQAWEEGRFDLIGLEICCAWEEGRQKDAKRLASDHLVSGKPLSKQFLKIAAALLHPPKQERGPKPPKHWFEVGRGYKDYLDYLEREHGPPVTPAAKKSRGVEAREAMSEKYGLNDPAIVTAIEYYEAADEEHDRVTELHLVLVREEQRYEHWRRHMIADLNFEHGRADKWADAAMIVAD